MALSLNQFVLALIFYLCRCFSVEVSKACFGSPGQTCVKHKLKCNIGRISIQEAFYMDTSACGIGVSDCGNVSLSSIPLNGTRYNFSDAELDSLNLNCSTQSTCHFRAERRGKKPFSAIKYQCMTGRSSTTQDAVHEVNAGAIAAGVIGILVVCAVVAAVLIWFKFLRNKKENKKRERGSTNHVYGVSQSSTATEDGGSRKTISNYDYATIHNGHNPVGRVQNHYVPAGKPSTDDGTTVFMEDDYNHINHNPPQGASSDGYDTTASAAAAVKKMNNLSFNSIDDDDYNHLGDGKPSVVSSDYDTTVSASKAVAQLGEMKDSEDDYDHFKRSEDRVIDLPNDTANHHSRVSADTTPNPYDLAK